MLEKIKNYMKSEGFVFDEVDEGLYRFQYEGINMLLFTKELPLLTMCVPCLKEKDEMDEMAFYKAINRINEKVRFVKSYDFLDSISLFYEVKIGDEEVVEELIDKMTDVMKAVTIMGHMIIKEVIENTENE